MQSGVLFGGSNWLINEGNPVVRSLRNQTKYSIITVVVALALVVLHDTQRTTAFRFTFRRYSVNIIQYYTLLASFLSGTIAIVQGAYELRENLG